MRNLVFRSKETSLEDKVQMAASAFSGLRTIQEESAEKIMDQLGNLNATRVLVTDASGLVLYDSLDEDAALGQYAVLPEIVQALGGNDVFYSSYGAGRLETGGYPHPVRREPHWRGVHDGVRPGPGGSDCCVAAEHPLDQRGSGGGGDSLLPVFFRGVFQTYAADFASIRIIREGDYSHKMQLQGA